MTLRTMRVDTPADAPRLWRIAADTPRYSADDSTGAGAKTTGGRWNRRGVPVLYASTSRALACLETVVHLGETGLPLNRWLVEIEVPHTAWTGRGLFIPTDHIGWDAEPAGRISVDWGSDWLASGRTLIAAVPSIIVPEEANVIINPVHPSAAQMTVRKIRRWSYDARLFASVR